MSCETRQQIEEHGNMSVVKIIGTRHTTAACGTEITNRNSTGRGHVGECSGRAQPEREVTSGWLEAEVLPPVSSLVASGRRLASTCFVCTRAREIVDGASEDGKNAWFGASEADDEEEDVDNVMLASITSRGDVGV